MQFQDKIRRPFNSTLSNIPEGAAGIKVTLKAMSNLVKAYKSALAIRTLSVQIVSGFAQKDYKGEVQALQQWVRDRIRYVKDVRDVETLQTPEVTLRVRSGDCDDKSTLLASLLESIGHETRFIAIGFQPGEFDHVYVESRIGAIWVPLETTEPVNMGWQPSGIKARMIQGN